MNSLIVHVILTILVCWRSERLEDAGKKKKKKTHEQIMNRDVRLGF